MSTSATPPSTSILGVIDRWKEHMAGHAPNALDELLDDNVVFYSPVVFTPQVGKDITKLYLSAASATFPGDNDAAGDAVATSGHKSFHYTKEVISGDTAMLEFETKMGGKYVNGIDIIVANDAGKIIEFRVMIRPLQAVNTVHQRMGEALKLMEGHSPSAGQ